MALVLVLEHRDKATSHHKALTLVRANRIQRHPPNNGDTMKIKFTGNCSVAGNHYDGGSTADLDKDVANSLIQMGRALPASSDRSVGLANSNAPAPKTRKKKA